MYNGGPIVLWLPVHALVRWHEGIQSVKKSALFISKDVLFGVQPSLPCRVIPDKVIKQKILVHVLWYKLFSCVELTNSCAFLTEIQRQISLVMWRGSRTTTTTSRTWRLTGTATYGFVIGSPTTASGTNTFHEWRRKITVRIWFCYYVHLCLSYLEIQIV